MCSLQGYFSTRIYSKMFHLTDWKRNTFWTAVFFPGVCFTVFFILNLFVWHTGSSVRVRASVSHRTCPTRRRPLFPLTLFSLYQSKCSRHAHIVCQSQGAVPFTTLLALLVLWFGISVPLVYIGSYFAFKNPDIKPPVPVNNIPRMIPEQAWYVAEIYV